MSSQAHKLSTVFVRCESESLERLSYKPDFPDSVFHLTIYDGRPSAFAAAVFRILNEFDWGLLVSLPPSHVEPVVRNRPKGQDSPNLSESARKLLRDFSGGTVNRADLLTIPDGMRLDLVRRICASLHAQSKAQVSNSSRVTTHPDRGGRQGELWPIRELMSFVSDEKSRQYSRRHHSAIGLYLTPPELAADIVAATISWFPSDKPIHFGDPAIGSGIFLAALAGAVGDRRIQSAIAVESDGPRASLTAERWRGMSLQVNVDDFVSCVFRDGVESERDPADSWLEHRRNLIIANPPYVRFQKLDQERARAWRESCRRLLGVPVDARSDLYVYFVLASQIWMSPGAIAAWLLPTEFMFTNYGEALRNYLVDQVTLKQIHVYGPASKFANARVSSCMVVFENSRPRPNDEVLLTSLGGASSPGISKVSSRRVLSGQPRWDGLFGHADGARPAEVPLKRLFTIRRGVATGANKIFVLDHAAVERLEIPRKWRKPVLPKAHLLKTSIIESDANGNPSNVAFGWLIDCAAPIEEVASLSPRFAEYLGEVQRAAERSFLVRRRRPFYRQESNRPARYLFTYMARPRAGVDRFRLNRSSAVALNNYLCLHPLDPLECWLAQAAGNDELLLKALNASVRESVGVGREYADGLVKFEPSNLGEVGLRDVPEDFLKGT
ncbi:Eco57I restriction-modification methylase domain-containing protein [Mycolicibacterium vaccae]|uniref:Eco57I restriction-modification methylase domain-containing protein n=1 Tax=Mycolicibacterium vaccae TaxID=1810 RepID=UPI003D065BC6